MDLSHENDMGHGIVSHIDDDIYWMMIGQEWLDVVLAIWHMLKD